MEAKQLNVVIGSQKSLYLGSFHVFWSFCLFCFLCLANPVMICWIHGRTYYWLVIFCFGKEICYQEILAALRWSPAVQNAFWNLIIQDNQTTVASLKDNFQQGQKSALQLILQSLAYEYSPKRQSRGSHPLCANSLRSLDNTFSDDTIRPKDSSFDWLFFFHAHFENNQKVL